MTTEQQAIPKRFGTFLEEQLTIQFFEGLRVDSELENRQEDLNIAKSLSRRGIELTREGIREVMRGSAKAVIDEIEKRIVHHYLVVNGTEEFVPRNEKEEPRILEVPEVSRCLLTAILGQEWTEFKLVSIFWPLIEGSVKEKDIRIPTHEDLFVGMPVYLQGMRDAITEMFRCLRDYRINNLRTISVDQTINLLERYMVVNKILYRFMERFTHLQNDILITIPDPDIATKMATKQHRAGGSYKMSLGQVRESATKVEEELLSATMLAMHYRDQMKAQLQPSNHTVQESAEHQSEMAEAPIVRTAQAS